MNTTNEAIAEQRFVAGILRRLRRRKLLIIAQTVLMFLVVMIIVEMIPKSYRGVASVAIEGQTPTAVATTEVMRDSPFDDQTLGTEISILQSHELLADTINRTGLLRKPEFNPSLRHSRFDPLIANLRSTVEAWLPDWLPVAMDDPVTPSERALDDTVDTLRRHVKLTPIPRSRVIEIEVTASNNVLTAQIANTIADLYITNHREYKIAASKEAHQFLDTRIGELKSEAATKAAAVEQYRIAHGLTTAMTATLIQEQVSGLSTQLQTARATLATLEGQAATAAKSNPQQLAQVLSSPTIIKYREQEGVIAADKSRLIAMYGPDSPMLSRVNGQLAAVQGQIAAEAMRAVKSLPNDVASARSSVSDMTQRLATLKQQASQMDEARAHLATLEDDSNSARSLYNAFNTRLRETDAAMAYGATNVRVISRAPVPTHAAFPNRLIVLPAGFVLASLMAGLTAYLTTKPKGIIGAREINTLFDDNIRPLGMIPLRTPRTMAHFDTAIEQLLNRLIMLDDSPKSILITSALPEEGKTTTAQALAEAALRRGLQVFLVDADMRSTRQPRARLRTTVPSLGLSDVVRGDVDVQDATRKIGKFGLSALPAGSPRGNPTSLLGRPRLGETIAKLRHQYDLVIVDAPPALVGGDAEMLARVVDATVVLVKWHSTPAVVVAEAINQLNAKNIAGMVLTMVDPDKALNFGQSDAVIYSKTLYRYYQS